MTDILSPISGALAAVKGIADIAVSLNNAELQKRIADLNLQLAETRNKEAEMLNELRETRTQLQKLKEKPLHYDGHVYRDQDDIPYCPACYGSHGWYIPLEYAEGAMDYHKKLRCPQCHSAYLKANQ
jgi:hypothetical protein